MKKTSTKKIFAFVLSLVMITSVITFNPAQKDVWAAKKSKSSGKVKSISVSNLPAKTLTLKKGKSKALKVSVKTSGKKTSKAYTFKSSKSSVVKVAKKGKKIKVTAKKKGKATITIKSKANPKKKVSIKVTVGTPVSKVKVNKKKATISKGKTVTLKATVSPKKASNKKVVWKSSNKKVATVTSKGVVKGIKAGTAKITAQAADGSGKKATSTITVTDATDIKSVQVLNSNSIMVTLSKAQQLTVKNFVVKTKQYDNGAYNKVCKIDNVSTNDKKIYYITLDSESTISVQKMVQVSVSGLSGVKGTKTVQVRYTKPKTNDTSEKIYALTYNEQINETMSLSGYGYSKLVSATGLPKGVSAKLSDSGSYVEFSGKPVVKGRYNAVISTEDELGNTVKYTVIFLIGATDSIVAGATPVRSYVGASGYYVDKAITVVGGSGSYTYQITGTNYGLSMEGGYVEGTLKTAGKYNITVKVTDVNNTKLTATTTLSIELKQAYTVTGVVKDASGNALPYADVSFDNKNEIDKFCTYRSTESNDKGVYSIEITAGTYDVLAEKSNAMKYLYSVKITGARSGLDISLPLYKIVIVSNSSTVAANNFGSWYDANGKYYGYGDTLYLKSGSYSLTCSANGGIFGANYTAKLNINVTKSQTVTASVTANSTSVDGTISAGAPVSTTLTGEYKYYKFVPTTSGTYQFYSTSEYDTYASLYDVEGNEIVSDDDSGEGSNFTFSYSCVAGQTYYLAVRKYSSGNITATICIEKL